MHEKKKPLFIASMILFLLFSLCNYAFSLSPQDIAQSNTSAPAPSAQQTVSSSPETQMSPVETTSGTTPSAEVSPVEATSGTSPLAEASPVEVTSGTSPSAEASPVEVTSGATPSAEASPVQTMTGIPSSATPVPAMEEERPAKDIRWFNEGRLSMLIAIILLSGFILYFIFSAQRGQELFIRRIAGLSALDDAVGRATEMGKPVLYIPGITDMNDIQTLAGLSILSYVAQKTAEYDTPILVPTRFSLVMSTAQEVVKESYTRAGRPDAFRPDNIRYLTDDQFGFVAGVDGIMVREQPSANFYMGCFYAESLILAETGHSTGAIQMAGTAMPSQLPFFVAACDYTLIGEELFAASAYLSRDPKQLGSLKGQDMGKLVFLFSIILGCILETIGIKNFTNLFITK